MTTIHKDRKAIKNPLSTTQKSKDLPTRTLQKTRVLTFSPQYRVDAVDILQSLLFLDEQYFGRKLIILLEL